MKFVITTTMKMFKSIAIVQVPCLFARTFECLEAGLAVNVSVSSSSCLPSDEVRVFRPPSSVERTGRIRSDLPRRLPRLRS